MLKLTRAGTGCPHGVVVKALHCAIVLSEFELHLGYYVHFP